MPCTNDDYSTNDERTYYHNGKMSARLCAVFSVLEKAGKLDSVLAKIDWREAGVSRKSTETWWKTHKQLDAERRKREKERRAEKAQANKIAETKRVSDLTPDERRLLQRYDLI